MKVNLYFHLNAAHTTHISLLCQWKLMVFSYRLLAAHHGILLRSLMKAIKQPGLLFQWITFSVTFSDGDEYTQRHGFGQTGSSS